MKAIEVKNLYKRYPHVTAVCNISFDVEKGEIFGFLGPNGAGKSTTVNMLCSLIKPTNGKITINGMDPFKTQSEVRKKIGIVFQEQILDRNLTVYENLYLHSKLYGVPKKVFLNRLQETLKFLDIEEKKDEYVKNLSGGTRRRVEVARVMLHRPEIVFLDEPTVGLDAQTKNKI
jgi:ABC-2 type transport system ATP-binding protein